MPDRTRVAVALGAGGARGYAHIGVLQVLEERGHEIVSIAGTSMGAVVGGLRAAGVLTPYTEWVRSLTQRDVLRLLDPSWSAPGAIRAEKILSKVGELVGSAVIEDLQIPFTAVATDLLARKEVWFQRGRLDAAIRASIGIPGVIWPVVMDGRLLADGGLMNPVPVVATAAMHADVTIAVSLSDEVLASEGWPSPEPARFDVSDSQTRSESELARNLRNWLDNIRGQFQDEAATDEDVPDQAVQEQGFERPPAGLRTRDVLDLSLDTMRSVMGRYRLAGYPPDVLITIPRASGGTMEFHRAEEMIEIGRERTRQALSSAAPR